MDETIYELEKILNKRSMDKEDHKVLCHAIICIYNTVKELADGKGMQRIQSDVQSPKRRSTNKK